MAIPILSEIERLINEHGSSVILKEHLSLLNTKLCLLREDIENLQKENSSLIERNAELEHQFSRQQTSNEFVESHGALFKLLPGGGYSETPYCPICQRSMYCFQTCFPYECSDDECGHTANFTGLELQNIISGFET